jgi:hypothetical protein
MADNLIFNAFGKQLSPFSFPLLAFFPNFAHPFN